MLSILVLVFVIQSHVYFKAHNTIPEGVTFTVNVTSKSIYHEASSLTEVKATTCNAGMTHEHSFVFQLLSF